MNDTIRPTAVFSDKQLENVNLEPDPWHGEWNYSIHPHPVS